MRCALINQFFPPDLAPTGQMAADLAEELVGAGHEVSVLASRGSYLGGERLPARTHWRRVHVHRVAATSLGKASLAHRALDYASFYGVATVALARMPRQDIVVSLTTPPLVAAAAVAQVRKGARHVYWVQDLYPEVAVAFGALGAGSVATRTMASVSRKVMRESAAVVVLGEAMKEKVVEAGADAARVHVVPNWADGDVVRPVPHTANPLRAELARGARFVVLYSGNIGKAHDVNTLVGAARALGSRPDVAIVFQGEGAKRAELELGVRGLANVRFAPYQPRERLGESLSAADVHLVSLSPGVLGLLEPSKLYGAMAAGRSTLYVGPDRSEVARTVREERIGACVGNGDVEGLVREVLRRADDTTLCVEEGARARLAFDRAYSRPRRTARLREILESVVT